MLRLSFIVPFYNVELYIEECIRSLYAQDIPWEEYEVICVDDCSPDGSRAIVERLQKEYPTLKLLTTPENLRQGGARNMALDIAQGRYISFVDSDDYIKPNCIGTLLAQAEEENLDILDFDFDSGTIGESMGMYKNSRSYSMGVCTGTEYVFDPRTPWASKCCCVCAMLIRKSFIDDNRLRFVEKMQYEDTDFSIKMFSRAERVKHIGDKLYVYRYVQDSVTHAIEIRYTNLLYRVELIKRLIHLHNLLNQELWKIAIAELTRNEVYNMLLDLKNANFRCRYSFYHNRLGRIPRINLFVGYKTTLALKSWIFLKLFYN